MMIGLFMLELIEAQEAWLDEQDAEAEESEYRKGSNKTNPEKDDNEAREVSSYLPKRRASVDLTSVPCKPSTKRFPSMSALRRPLKFSDSAAYGSSHSEDEHRNCIDGPPNKQTAKSFSTRLSMKFGCFGMFRSRSPPLLEKSAWEAHDHDYDLL